MSSKFGFGEEGNFFFKCEIVIRLSNYCTRIDFQYFQFFKRDFGWKRSVGKKSPGCAKNMLFKSIFKKRSENLWWGGEERYLPTWLIFFLSCRKMYKWDTLLESFTVVLCVIFLSCDFVSKGSIKNWSHIIFCLEFSWANSHFYLF